MSRIYWHTRNGKAAELRGSERAHLDFITRGPVTAAWDLDRFAGDNLDRARRIVEMIPEVPDGEYGANYLHTNLKAALREDKAIKAYYAYHYSSDKAIRNVGLEPRQGDQRVINQFIRSLGHRIVGLGATDTTFVVNGHTIDSWQLGLNTAIRMGSDVVKLAAKIHSKCEVHGFFEGEDREWVVDIIKEGLDIGVYRTDQGWSDVIDLLMSDDQEPVVMSYSVCDGFPNQYITDWVPPAGQKPEYVSQERWDEADEDSRREYQQDLFGELPADEQWDLAMEGLRTSRPYNRISPESLDDLIFPGLTIYDIMAPDRDERVDGAFRGA